MLVAPRISEYVLKFCNLKIKKIENFEIKKIENFENLEDFGTFNFF